MNKFVSWLFGGEPGLVSKAVYRSVVWMWGWAMSLALCRTRSPPSGRDPSAVLAFGPDAIDMQQLTQGVFITGAVGSGKTSGPMTYLTEAILERGAGCLWMTCKVNEVEKAVEIAKKAGREKDIVLLGPNHPNGCDLLAQEFAQCRSVDNTAQLIDSLMSIGTRQDDAGAERFWKDASERLIRMCLTALSLGGERMSFINLYRMLSSLPATLAIRKDVEWHKGSYCFEVMSKALAGPDGFELNLCGQYLLGEYPVLSDKTQSSILTMALTTVTRLLSGPFAKLVSAETDTVLPRDVLDGRVLIFDASVQEWRESGRLFQLATKMAVVRSVLRRKIEPGMRPVLLVADEAQNFLIPEFDSMAQAVGRESRLISLNAVQSLSLAYVAMGGGDKARQEVHAWIGNHRTKFMCSNDEEETNEFFSKLLGQHRELMFGGSGSSEPYNAAADALGVRKGGQGNFNEQWQPLVRSEDFTRLRTGGPRNDWLIEAILFQGGRVFSNGLTHKRVVFKQEV